MTSTDRRSQRRRFLRRAITAAGGVAMAPVMEALGRLNVNGRVFAEADGYGPLAPVPDLRDGVPRIALPEGFQYRSFSVAGEIMSDGARVPLAHDGMAVFNVNGTLRLVRNHEDRNPPGAGSTTVDAVKAYDIKGGGGTTTLVVNPFTRELERHFTSLSGTTVNCAGGATPWGSWITCEETNAGLSAGWLKPHGYCFEVPAVANGQVPAIALTDMGRFAHEAMAVDPATWIVYETEDNGSTSGFYRFIADTPGRLALGGRLEMLAVDGVANYDTRTGQSIGVSLPVTWVPIADPNPAGTSSTAVYGQGFAGGGARFARLEGCWWGDGAVYFVSTNGGDAGSGQVWAFTPTRLGGTLTLIYESPNASVLDAPDNVTVSPRGGLLLCEDGGGDQYLRGLTIRGEIFDFALNLQTGHEWAGATFAEADPRGERVTLFVNRQGATVGANPPAAGDEGMTFAIWGPWRNGAL